jgi:hypothetical protein
LTLDLHGPIRVAPGATLELDAVTLMVSDSPGAPNGTSGLRCDGPAHIVVRHSAMAPEGSAHPMWRIEGDLEVDEFTTSNSEFHLRQVKANLSHLKIFELEISLASQVTADHLDLVFLSTHTGEDDHLQFSNIPVDRAFSKKLSLGSGAHADLSDTRVQMFLLYVHGRSEATLSHMDRVQLAMFPKCEGTFRLTKGRLGSAGAPAIFPEPGSSNCPFRIALNDVQVDTWDVYAQAESKLTFDHSQIDELVASDRADITVRDSNLYADWLAVSGDAQVRVEKSTVGALRLVKERPDLATSEVHVSGQGSAAFSDVRFDCGIVSADGARVEISHAREAPKYLRHSGHAEIRVDGKTVTP